jgi:hypothetical protein
MVQDPLGKFAAQPEIMDLVLENLHRASVRQRHWAEVQASDVTVLQQRTFYSLPDRIAGSADPRTISLSNALLVVTHSLGQDVVVCEFSTHDNVLEWRWEGCMAKPFGAQAEDPFIPLSMVNERGLSLGFVMLNDGFGSVRIVFADGSTFEDSVVNDSVLFYVPYRTDAIWAKPADAWMYDRKGREVLNGKVRVQPYPDSADLDALRKQMGQQS